MRKDRTKTSCRSGAAPGPAVSRKRIGQVRELLGRQTLTDELVASLVEEHGSLGFILNVLKDRPRNFNPFILKGMAIYKEPSSLDRRSAELVAIGAAAALRCDHCLEAHMRRALDEGASLADVMDALLIAGAIADSSTLSVAFRKYRQLEGRMKKGDAGDE